MLARRNPRSDARKTTGPIAVLSLRADNPDIDARPVDVRDGKPLIYDPGRYHNERGMFASNGRLHDLVLSQVAGVW